LHLSPRVLLASDRPSVQACFFGQSRRSRSGLKLVRVPIDDGRLDAWADEVAQAIAVIVDVGADPDGGVRLCVALRKKRPDLRILAIVCCSKPTLAWHVQELIENGIDEVLDAQVTPAEIVAALEDNGTTARTRIQLRGKYALVEPAARLLNKRDRRLLELVALGRSDERAW